MVGVNIPDEAALLSALTVDTDLAMGAHNITLDAAQTVDGEDVSEIKASQSLCLMGKNETPVVHNLTTDGWYLHAHGDFRSPFYVAKAGTYTLHASIRCYCDTEARSWQIRLDEKAIQMGTSGGSYHVLTASLASQALTVGWKTVKVYVHATTFTRQYFISDLVIGIVED